MRIGFLGNANNYPFLLARAIRAMGHDVVFLVAGDQILDRPENRYPDISPGSYPDWIVDLGVVSPEDYVFPTSAFHKAVKLLSECDAVVVNGFGPALALSCHRPSVAILTGGDLEPHADWNYPIGLLKDFRRQRRLVGTRGVLTGFYVTYRQRRGIRGALAVCYFPEGVVPAGDRLLSSIMRTGQVRLSLMMTDTEAIRPIPPPANRKIRVFNVARLIWKRPDPRAHSDLDFKGTDILLKGAKRFVERHGDCIELVLVRKGLHVAETLDLVKQLELPGTVTWVDEMSQKDVLEQYRLADIVTEQLATSTVGMGGLDAMAVGRPVIANGRAEIQGSPLGRQSPVCQATNEGEVAAHLERLVFDPAERLRIGKLSREYVEEHLSASRAAKIVTEILSAGLSTTGSQAARGI